MKSFHLIIVLFVQIQLFAGASSSKLVKTDSVWELYYNNVPYTVKGVTFGFDKEIDKYDQRMKELKSMGVNSIRLWGTNKDSKKLLDAAYENGITVMVGIWMRHGRAGMEADDSFDYLHDKKGMDDMYNYAMRTVDEFKKHPALLTWGVGNEVYLNIATDAEKLAYSKFLERVCKDIKLKDPEHVITSVEAWTFGLNWWKKYCPSIDLYGINSYGSGCAQMQNEITKRGIDKPYIITEFGVFGEWDQQYDKNGVKLDPTDKEKYDAISIGVKKWATSKNFCLGTYVFHFGDSDDFGATWLLTHFRGKIRPQYWAIREAYTGKKPTDSHPTIDTFALPKTDNYRGGEWVKVHLKFSDKEDKELRGASFFYNQRIGTREEKSKISFLYSRMDENNDFLICLPNVDGPVKIYVMVMDSANNLSIATSSARVRRR